MSTIAEFFTEVSNQLERGKEKYGQDQTLNLINDIDQSFYLSNIIKYASRLGHGVSNNRQVDLAKIVTYAFFEWKRLQDEKETSNTNS